MAWGYHLVLDCHSCDADSIKNDENIINFAKELVETIDMVAYGEPLVIHFGKDDKAGYTLVQLIETSNICGHFAEDTNNAYLDVFSCKPYEQDAVVATVEKFFKPKNIDIRFMERD